MEAYRQPFISKDNHVHRNILNKFILPKMPNQTRLIFTNVDVDISKKIDLEVDFVIGPDFNNKNYFTINNFTVCLFEVSSVDEITNLVESIENNDIDLIIFFGRFNINPNIKIIYEVGKYHDVYRSQNPSIIASWNFNLNFPNYMFQIMINSRKNIDTMLYIYYGNDNNNNFIICDLFNQIIELFNFISDSVFFDIFKNKPKEKDLRLYKPYLLENNQLTITIKEYPYGFFANQKLIDMYKNTSFFKEKKNQFFYVNRIVMNVKYHFFTIMTEAINRHLFEQSELKKMITGAISFHDAINKIGNELYLRIVTDMNIKHQLKDSNVKDLSEKDLSEKNLDMHSFKYYMRNFNITSAIMIGRHLALEHLMIYSQDLFYSVMFAYLDDVYIPNKKITKDYYLRDFAGNYERVTLCKYITNEIKTYFDYFTDYNYDFTVYTGVPGWSGQILYELFDNYDIDTDLYINLKSFTATSVLLNSHGAINYILPENPVIFKIKINHLYTKYINLAPISNYPVETEILLADNSFFKIVSVKKVSFIKAESVNHVKASIIDAMQIELESIDNNLVDIIKPDIKQIFGYENTFKIGAHRGEYYYKGMSLTYPEEKLHQLAFVSIPNVPNSYFKSEFVKNIYNLN
jgi:hypothetical protein